MRDWKATKGPVSPPLLSPKAESQQQSTEHSLLHQQESVLLHSHHNNNQKQGVWILDFLILTWLVNSLLVQLTISWNWKFLFAPYGSTDFTPWWRVREAWKHGSTGILNVFNSLTLFNLVQTFLIFFIWVKLHINLFKYKKAFYMLVLEGTYCVIRAK